MVDIASSNNALLKNIGKNLANDNALQQLYGADKAQQTESLKKIFTAVSSNNISESEKKALLTTAEKLKEKLDALEGKMATLSEQMKKNEDKVNKKADEIANLIAAIDNKSSEMEKKQHENVKNVVSDVFREYERGTVKKDEISSQINIRLRKLTYKGLAKAQIQALQGRLKNNQKEVNELASMASKWIDTKNVLQQQYGVTESAYNLINKSINQIGALGTSYTNSDFDGKIPVYSLEKTDIVSDLFADTSINVAPTNSSYVEGSTKPQKLSKDAITQKYSQYFAPTVGKVDGDVYSDKNPAFKSLDDAIKAGMLNDLYNSNMTTKEIAQFLATNYAGAKISFNDQSGELTIPWGHGTFARGVCNNLRDFIANGIPSEDNKTYKTWEDRNFIKNTWSKSQGNTIDSNAQIQSLAGNYEEILDKLMKGNPAFTFKEAMYALFDKENGLFKNSGITFDPTEKDPNKALKIGLAGDKETADLYAKIAGKIQDGYGIKVINANDGIGINNSGGLEGENPNGTDGTNGTDGKKEDPNKPVEVKKIDPVTFTTTDAKGNKIENAFIVDRNKDGKFTGTNEFLGADDGKTWLDDLKSLDADGDGKLTGDELKNLKVLSSTYHDNTQAKGTKGISKTDIDYSMSNAQELGIEEIDLNGLEEMVNKSTGTNDINGSEIFNDGFSFKMNGQEVTASRKDDTEAFMDIVYGAAKGKRFNIGLTEKDIEKEMNRDNGAYNKIDKFVQEHQKTFQSANLLLNFDNLTRETEQASLAAEERMEADESQQKIQAAQKAAALHETADWSTVLSEIRTIANNEGLSIDLVQAKGIFMREEGLTARDVVDKYKEQAATQDDIELQRSKSKTAVEALIKCSKNGMKDVTIREIREMISQNPSYSADDIVDKLKETHEYDNL